MILKDKLLVAVWKNMSVPVVRGQRLLALRTHTSGHTLYLFDSDGERPGWVSGDVVEAAGWEPNHCDIYVATVGPVDTQRYGDGGRFKVSLQLLRISSDLTNKLRDEPSWHDGLGDGPSSFVALLGERLHWQIFVGDSRMSSNFPNPQQLSKGTSMSASITKAAAGRISRTVADNTDAMKNAAYLEAGVITNRQLAKLAGAKAPLMVRGYIDTPIGKLVIANLFKVLVHELRADNKVLQRLSDASLEAAHLDVIRTLDLDGLIDSLLSQESIKRVMSNLDGSEA